MHERIAAGGHAFARRLECSYMPRAALRRHDPAHARHPRLSAGGRLALATHATDWVIERQILRERGVVLSGPPPRELIDPVSKAEIREAVVGVLRGFWARQLVEDDFLRPREYQCFAVLTMCRALYTLACGAMVSKPAAARWALASLVEPWSALVASALAWPSGDQADALEETRALIRYTLARAADQSEGSDA